LLPETHANFTDQTLFGSSCLWGHSKVSGGIVGSSIDMVLRMSIVTIPLAESV